MRENKIHFNFHNKIFIKLFYFLLLSTTFSYHCSSQPTAYIGILAGPTFHFTSTAYDTGGKLNYSFQTLNGMYGFYAGQKYNIFSHQLELQKFDTESHLNFYYPHLPKIGIIATGITALDIVNRFIFDEDIKEGISFQPGVAIRTRYKSPITETQYDDILTIKDIEGREFEYQIINQPRRSIFFLLEPSLDLCFKISNRFDFSTGLRGMVGFQNQSNREIIYGYKDQIEKERAKVKDLGQSLYFSISLKYKMNKVLL
jgi:hypothetical protein